MVGRALGQDEHDKEDHKHEVTVVLSGITKDPMHGDNTVLYAFDVKVRASALSSLGLPPPCSLTQRTNLVHTHGSAQVFGVTVYKFFDRYSRLRSVHQNMKAAGCLDSFPIDFPAKSWLTDHASDANAQQTRGQQLLGYYASLFTNAQVRMPCLRRSTASARCLCTATLARSFTHPSGSQVMNHARTRELLGFDATNIDEAKAKRKDLHAKIAKEPPIAATVINFSVGDYVKILHEFDGNTYQDPDQWRAVDDLELAIGDVVVVAGKATHEEEHIEGWYRGYKVGRLANGPCHGRPTRRRTRRQDFAQGWLCLTVFWSAVQVDVRDEVKNFPATPRFARLCTEAERNEALEAARSALHQKHAAEATFEPHAEAAGAGGAPKRARRKQGDNGGGGGCCASRPSD